MLGNLFLFGLGWGLALPFAMIPRALGKGRRLLGASLVTLPLIYAAFAVAAGQTGAAAIEVVLGLPFIAAGLWTGAGKPERLGLWVAGFWAAHAGYDVAVDLQLLGLEHPGTPFWYPMMCAGFDMAVGAMVLRWIAEGRAE